MRQTDARHAKKALKLQLLLGLVAVALALPFGFPLALSILVGAGSCLLANLVFAVWIFRDYRAQSPERLALRFYGAEILKIGLLLFLFALAFVTLNDLNLPALLGAYFVVQVVPTLIAAQSGNPSGNQTKP